MVSVMVGSVYLWPAYVVGLAGPGAYASLLAATVVAASVTVLQAAWMRRMDYRSYPAAMEATWSPWLAPVLTWITMLLMLALDAVILYLYGELLQTFFYPATPSWVTVGTIGALAVWIAVRSLTVVARNVQFWFPLLLASFLLVVALSAGDMRFPMAATPNLGVPPGVLARASVATWFLYANPCTTAALLPHVRRTGRWSAGTVAVAAIALEGVILMVILFIALATLGPAVIPDMTWPIIYIFSIVKLSSFFVQDVGMLILIIWTTAIVLHLAVHSYVAAWNVGPPVGGYNPRRQYLVAGLGLALVAGALSVGSVAEAEVWLFQILTPADLAWTVAVVAATTLVAWWRTRRTGAPDRAGGSGPGVPPRRV